MLQYSIHTFRRSVFCILLQFPRMYLLSSTSIGAEAYHHQQHELDGGNSEEEQFLCITSPYAGVDTEITPMP